MSYSPELQQSQGLKQTQRMMMSPQMQQAIHFLQMPMLEMVAAIKTELEQNPILEEIPEDPEIELEASEEPEDADQEPEKELSFDDHDFEVMKRLDEEFRDHFAESGSPSVARTSEEDKLKSYLESSIRDEPTLFEHLMVQAKETFSNDEDLKMAETLMGTLDENGLLQTPLEEVAHLNGFDLSKLTNVLKEIQTFEPWGIGARSLQEALLIQLRCQGKELSLAYSIVSDHYENLLKNRIPAIQKGLKSSSQSIRKAIDEDIAKLDLHPGIWEARQVVQPIVPDVFLRKEGDRLVVDLDEDLCPSIRFNRKYMRMLEDETLSAETKDFIKKKVVSAKWLLRNVHQRNQTIGRIVKSLAEKQEAFFLEPDGKLKPLAMKVLAEELELHESTIARAVANKYLECPRGVFPLKYFFSNAYVTEEGEDMSSKTVRDVLLDIVEKEDKQSPLSDAVISKLMKERGIPCARRTLAKYRAELNIGNTRQRRRF